MSGLDAASRSTILGALQYFINENSDGNLVIKDGTITVDIIDSKDPKRRHTLEVQGSRSKFSGMIRLDDNSEVKINNESIEKIEDFKVLAFTSEQVGWGRNNVLTTRDINEAVENAKQEKPAIFSAIPPLGPDFVDPRDAQHLYRTICTNEREMIFAVLDAAASVDGNPGTPWSNILTGPLPGAHEHHPTLLAANEGISFVHFVTSDQVETFGEIPEHIQVNLPSLENSYPIHPYHLELMEQEGYDRSSGEDYSVVTLMSKRSSIPFGIDKNVEQNLDKKVLDFQVKTSLPAKATSRVRNIPIREAIRGVEMSEIVAELADQGLWPENVWSLQDFCAGHIPGDKRSVFMVRGGLQDAVSHEGVGLSSKYVPIPASAVWSENIITPGTSVFNSMASSGLAPETIFKDISKLLFESMIDFVQLGAVPEAHSQNVIYLFDKEQGKFSGLLLRDNEGIRHDPEKLSALGFDIEINYTASDMDDRMQEYFNYVFSSHLDPLAEHITKTNPGIQSDQLKNIAADVLVEVAKAKKVKEGSLASKCLSQTRRANGLDSIKVPTAGYSSKTPYTHPVQETAARQDGSGSLNF